MRVINNLEKLIKETGVNQTEIADAAGVSQGTFSRYVKGQVESVKFDIEAKLCKYFTTKLGRKVGRDDIFSYDFSDETA